MSWSCRYDVLDQCARRNQPCHPGVKGCVLEGKVVFTRELDRKASSAHSEPEVRKPAPVSATKPKAKRKAVRPK